MVKCRSLNMISIRSTLMVHELLSLDMALYIDDKINNKFVNIYYIIIKLG